MQNRPKLCGFSPFRIKKNRLRRKIRKRLYLMFCKKLSLLNLANCYQLKPKK